MKLELYSDGYRQKTSGYSKRICLNKDNEVLANGFFRIWSSLSGQKETRTQFGVVEGVSHDLKASHLHSITQKLTRRQLGLAKLCLCKFGLLMNTTTTINESDRP